MFNLFVRIANRLPDQSLWRIGIKRCWDFLAKDMRLPFLLSALVFLFWNEAIAGERKITIYPRDFGAMVDDGLDDFKAFDSIFRRISAGGYSKAVIILEDGLYDLHSELRVSGLQCNVTFLGKKHSGFKILGRLGMLLSAKASYYKSDHRISHGDTSILLDGILDGVKAGDILHIQSDSKFETGWGYKENDIHRISKIVDNRIYLSDPVIFNYNEIKEQVRITSYSKYVLTLRNISFVLSPMDDSIRTEALKVLGISINAENIDIKYTGKQHTYFHNGFSIAACVDVVFRNVVLDNLMYGIVMNFCRNVKGEKTKAFYTRHAYVPATATCNVNISDLFGYQCHSVMDAHVAFNVTYTNVVDTLATKYPDCRALGMTLKDIVIYPGHHDYQLYTYWSVQNLVKEYGFLYEKTDQLFDNVHWVGPTPGVLNGLNSYTCRTLTIKNCKTHSVSYYGDQIILKRVDIIDSEVGLIYNMAQNTRVANVKMRGDLFPNAPFVFRFGGIGDVQISDVTVRGYNADSAYLFANFHNQPKRNSLLIERSEFQKLRAWTDKLVDPGTKYTTLRLKNVKFDGFKEPKPKEISF